MEPFREVRSPERNYGPARLSGGTVVTPLARRLAGEAGIDLARVTGSGPHGRVVARDVEIARKAPAPAQAHAIASIVLTADVGIGQALALCADVPTIELADIIIKAWAIALARAPSKQSVIALALGKSRSAIHGAESKSLTAIAAARRELTDDGQGASTAIFVANVPGIRSVAAALQPPHTTMLSIGSPRRAPVEAADGSVRFVDMMTVALTCDTQVVDSALGAGLLASFKGFVEKPVTMIV